MRLRLPKIDLDYRLFWVKKNVMGLVAERGYEISAIEKEIFLSKKSIKDSYEKFLGEYKTDDDEVIPYERCNSNHRFIGYSGDESILEPNLEVFFCSSQEVKSIFDKITINRTEKHGKKTKKSASKKKKGISRDVLFISDGLSELFYGNLPSVRIEILMFQQLNIDPRLHFYSSSIEVMKEDEITELFEPEKMKGKTTCLIQEGNDPLCMFLPLTPRFSSYQESVLANDAGKPITAKPRMIRITTDNIYCGPPRKEVSYRKVV